MGWENILKVKDYMESVSGTKYPLQPMTDEEKVKETIKSSGSLGALGMVLTSMLRDGYNFQDNNKVETFASIINSMYEGSKKGHALIPPTDEQIPVDLNIKATYDDYVRTGHY